MFKPRGLRKTLKRIRSGLAEKKRFHEALVGPDALVRAAEQSSAGSLEDPTFRPQRSRPLCAIALLVLISMCSIPPLRAQSPELPPGPIQAKVQTACLECHAASIIIQQRLSKAAWTKEVDKMIKWGALVDPADRDSFIDYLSTNFPPDKPPAEMPRTASMKKR
jgi:hypothetical protein